MPRRVHSRSMPSSSQPNGDTRTNEAMLDITNLSNEHGSTASTKKAYGYKQRLWFQWCTEMNFVDGATVHSNKLAHWIYDFVMLRESNRRGKKRKRAIILPSNGRVHKVSKSNMPAATTPSGTENGRADSPDDGEDEANTQAQDEANTDPARNQEGDNPGSYPEAEEEEGHAGSDSDNLPSLTDFQNVLREGEFVNHLSHLTISLGASSSAPAPPTEERFKQATKRIYNCKLKYGTIEGYVSAVCALYEQQRQANTNSNCHPREGVVASLLAALARLQHKESVESFEDTGVGSSYDSTLSREQLQAMILHNIGRNQPLGIRDAAALSFGTFGLLRGDSQRKLFFNHLSVRELEGEGPTPCHAVVAIVKEPKLNKNGKEERVGFMRNRDVFVCPVFYLALWLFARFHMGNEKFPESNTTFPCLSRRRHWYDMFLFNAHNDPRGQLGYDAHNKSVKKVIEDNEALTTAGTHISRKAGEQLAEAGGAPVADINRKGLWNESTLENGYTSHIPRRTLRVLAGFRAEGETYYLPRDVEVPDDLAARIFPYVEYWEAHFRTPERRNRDMAAVKFLELLRYLRKTFLQDLVVFRQRVKDFFIWDHPLFSSKDFLRFEKAAKREIDKRAVDWDQRPQQALPLLMATLSAHQKEQLNLQRTSNENNDKNFNKLHELLQQVLSHTIDNSTGIAQTRDLLVNIFQSGLDTLNRSDSQRSQPSNVPPPVAAVRTPPQDNASSRTAPEQTTQLNAPSSTTSAADIPSAANFKMSRKTTTVQQLWLEYSVGLNGQPSIKSMYEDRDGPRPDGTEGRFWRRRQPIIQAVKHLAEQDRIPPAHAAQRLDQACRNSRGIQTMSLHALGEKLCAARAADKKKEKQAEQSRETESAEASVTPELAERRHLLATLGLIE